MNNLSIYKQNEQQLLTRQKLLDKRKNPVELEGEPPVDLAELIGRVVLERKKTIIPKLGNRVQCDTYRLRSLQDTYSVAKSYFPEITLPKLVKAFKKLKKDGIIVSDYCSVIQKIVHYNKNILYNSQTVRNSLGPLNITKKAIKTPVGTHTTKIQRDRARKILSEIDIYHEMSDSDNIHRKNTSMLAEAKSIINRLTPEGKVTFEKSLTKKQKTIYQRYIS